MSKVKFYIESDYVGYDIEEEFDLTDLLEVDEDELEEMSRIEIESELEYALDNWYWDEVENGYEIIEKIDDNTLLVEFVCQTKYVGSEITEQIEFDISDMDEDEIESAIESDLEDWTYGQYRRGFELL